MRISDWSSDVCSSDLWPRRWYGRRRPAPGSALLVVAGDAHDVLAVGGGEVGVGIDQRLTHALGMVGGLAEDDGLGKAVSGAQELAHLGCDQFGALFEKQIAGEVTHVVFAVFVELALQIGRACCRERVVSTG